MPFMVIRLALLTVLTLLASGRPLSAQDSRARHSQSRASELTRRPDDRRPDDQLTTLLWGRPLTIGGELETEVRYQGNFTLRNSARNDEARFQQELEVELFYPLRDDAFLFLSGNVLYRGEPYDEAGEREFNWTLRRDETWLYVDNIWNSGVSLQLGRQNFREAREWWWDRELDAVRLHYERPTLHAEIAVARKAARIATDETFGPLIFDKTTRLLGQTTWVWGQDQRFDVFFLHHLDPAAQEVDDERLKSQGIKRSKTRLWWLGGRLSGRQAFARVGRLFYQLDGAWVGGREILLGCAVTQDADCRTPMRRTRTVSGWAFDGVLSWETRLPGRLTFTVGYAYGSGQRTRGRGATHAFWQTGLQDNENRFRGENHFHYYGELLRPELSNLHIWTAALGFRFWSSSSVEFVYHFYQQAHPAPFVRNARLRVDPVGKRSTLGQEWDLVIGLEEWKHIDVALVGSLFRAGAAYGPLSGETAYGLTLEVEYNF